MHKKFIKEELLREIGKGEADREEEEVNQE